MSNQSTTVIGQPAAVAICGSTLAVGDLTGNLVRCGWPQGTAAVLVRAHDDRGPLAPTAGGFVTGGGWDPTVRCWETGGRAPRWSARPVDGRITAVHATTRAHGGAALTLAAGADRAPGVAGKTGDRLDLTGSRVFSFDGSGRHTVVLSSTGEIAALAGGDRWWAALDRGGEPGVRLIVDGAETPVPLLDGAVRAIAGRGDILAIATSTRVWSHDVATGRSTALAELRDDDLTILALTVAGDHVVGSTSEGVVWFPGGHRQGRNRSQPVSLAGHGQDVIVLWPDGAVEQRAADGSVVESLTFRIRV